MFLWEFCIMVLNIVSSTILYAPYTWLTFIWRHCVLVLEIPLGGLDVYSSLKLLVVIPRSGKTWCGLRENGCFMSQMSQWVMSHESWVNESTGRISGFHTVSTKCRLQTADRVQNADWQEKLLFCVRNVPVKSKLKHPPGHNPGIWRLFLPGREGIWLT